MPGLLWVLPKFGPLKLVAVKGPDAGHRSRLHPQRDCFHDRSSTPCFLDLHPPRLQANWLRIQPPAIITRHTRQSRFGPETQTLRRRLLQSQDPRHPLPDRDLDTGRVVQPGGYSLTDSTYANLLHRLTRSPRNRFLRESRETSRPIMRILTWPFTTKKDPTKWEQVQADLSDAQGDAHQH